MRWRDKMMMRVVLMLYGVLLSIALSGFLVRRVSAEGLDDLYGVKTLIAQLKEDYKNGLGVAGKRSLEAARAARRPVDEQPLHQAAAAEVERQPRLAAPCGLPALLHAPLVRERPATPDPDRRVRQHRRGRTPRPVRVRKRRSRPQSPRALRQEPRLRHRSGVSARVWVRV